MPKAAYLIIALDVLDPEAFRRHERETAPLLEAFGGEILAATSDIRLEDGQWPRQRITVMRFPSREQAEGFHRSPAYRDLESLRRSARAADVILAESPAEETSDVTQGTATPHYVLGGVTVTDPSWIGEYMQTVPAISARYGVEGLVMGGEFTVLEGTWSHSSAVLLKLPSRQAFEGFWRGDEYRPMKALREANSLGDHISFAGVIEPVR